ncbi:peptidase S9 [Pseudoxanthomonas dokdonensis]|uniref:Peptidase S9 n=1 Tax=Pseudoxanthomonas dokdonensis TaxID=344882 RepID=A0A0R0CGB6_9GAMM|nr:peptidase S9 [Pseudoxanthomonas dokdonensis]
MDLAGFLKHPTFLDLKLSPSGEYFAATVPHEDQVGMVIIRRADNKVVSNFSLGKDTAVTAFYWVSPTRVVLSGAEKFGSLEVPVATGELYAVSVDGSKPTLLAGFRAPRAENREVTFLADDLPGDDQHMIVSVWSYSSSGKARADRMDVATGKSKRVARAPMQDASFKVDNAGEVRFAQGEEDDNSTRLYYRQGSDEDWVLVNDSNQSDESLYVLGFSADNARAYLQVENASGADTLETMEMETLVRSPLLAGSDVDPSTIIYSLQSPSVPAGAIFMDGRPKAVFFDETSATARLYRSLEEAFPGQAVFITSHTDDGRLALVQVQSDRNEGDFYVFDTVSKKADYLASRRQWLDPGSMGVTTPFAFKARDGMQIHGYLTRPAGASDSPLPMVVMPHGGPFFVQDDWFFDDQTQLLAAAGYAVLRVNFRGSGGYGQAFAKAGARQWGKAMQDDLTDATTWAVHQGFAEPSRICIYGASYGGYAALMGVAREPDLYRCAAGYVGVYDLPTMFKRGDIKESKSGRNYLDEWIGDGKGLEQFSPTNLADRIKVPVFLAAGGSDSRAPIRHSHLMARRIKDAGGEVETLYYDTEGHGFYTLEHRKAYYTQLLDFLSRNIGGQKAK